MAKAKPKTKAKANPTVCNLVLAGDAAGLRRLLEDGGDANEEHHFRQTAWWPEAEGPEGTICVEYAPALVLAAKTGRADLVTILLGHGARIDANAYHMAHIHITDDDLYPFDSTDALSIATRMGHLEVIRILLKAKAHGGSPGESSEPLQQAVSGGQLEVVRVLMERGIDVTTPYQGRMTPLMLAAEKGHLKLVELLLPEVARIGALKSEGDQIDQRVYAMGLAAREGHAKVVATLLAKGVPVDSRDASGETALMRAAMAGSGTVAKLLLKQGANTRLKNHKKETALDLAKDLGHGYLGEKDHKKIMRLLNAHEK